MPPDLNTLPTSRPPSGPGSPIAARPRRISISTQEAARPSPPSPRSPSLSSLQAAATINAGLHRSPSRASPSVERRRSSLMNNLLLNDPAMPGPGELQQNHTGQGSNTGSPRLGRRSFVLHTADPHHHRQPSLGELHQELENEQEAQVNRLLHMIRIQQDQLAAIHRQQSQATEVSPSSAEHTRFPTPPSGLAAPTSTAVTEASSPAQSHATPAHATPQHFNRPHSLSRRSSALISTPGSRGTSPALRPQSSNLGPLTEDFLLGGTRDETAFYQAETQTLTRENQMLKLRIRELEHQIAALGGTGAGAQNHTHQHSPLASPPATSGPQQTPAAVVTASADAGADPVAKE
ncbi:hypothetical protein CKM354_000039800 [Cercospora kikuchii]|uniref:Uncharacterized protein n=1 Tax=Cercospora kikuchii TaxID=84275 RepID=A0A9P3F7Q8_9PEZI|nr:uncharacterized protein CKM354_000039800 [Cercospora kikuchii]GIZ36933.1 hypothetical protein CKM354_000039800 [Cercospora kikuchii]